MRQGTPVTSRSRQLPAFRLRGQHHVSRIESFSDAVFGFSITLLVVSLQVPKTFDQLLATLAGFPAFAFAFALLAEIWYVQYRFFRRYALQDTITIVLNIALLFVIVFFTYPLKFLFVVALSGSNGGSVIGSHEFAAMYAVYALGYSAVFAFFFALHAHALRKCAELALTPFEAFETRRSMILAVFQIGVAMVSVGGALYFSAHGAYGAAGMFGGLAYLLVPVGITVISFALRRERLRFALPAAES